MISSRLTKKKGLENQIRIHYLGKILRTQNNILS